MRHGGGGRWRRSDDGSAVVEFVWLAVLLLVPLVYVVLSGLAVQRTAFAVTAAARAAARAYATAGSDAEGERRAEVVVAVVMRDQGVAWHMDGRVVQCAPCDYAPGRAFTIELRQNVALPVMHVGIVVRAHHTSRLDCLAGAC